MRSRVLVVAACLLAVALMAQAVVAEENFPLATLLEHTAITSDRFAPEGRTRLEKMQQTREKRMPEFLGAKVDQILYHGEDATVQEGRSSEPSAPQKFSEAPLHVESERAPRPCSGGDCGRRSDLPLAYVPPPRGPATSSQTEAKKPDHNPYPQPPNPELPLPTPAFDCGGYCNTKAADPFLARVPAPPLDNIDVATVGLEGKVLAKVQAKLRNREGWLRAQKLWLSKASEVASAVRREIELAENTKENVIKQIDRLKQAQDQISLQYKVHKLKWAYKDKKITMEEVFKRQKELDSAKADISHQMREAKDEVIVLENTLGPPSQQVQISEAELEDPLAFLKDVIEEHNYSNYEA